MNVQKSTVALIVKFEGKRTDKATGNHIAYKGKGEQFYTIGYGHYGADVKPNQQITQAQAEQYLATDLKEKADYINKHVITQLSQHCFDALCSFVYNRGQGNFQKSRLLKVLNTGDFARAADAFLDDENWNISRLPFDVRQGLLKRRKSEREYFLTED